MVVHKEISITATSTDSWEEAAMNAVSRTEHTVENLQWAVVQDLSIDIEDLENPQYKAKVKVGFEVEE